jgi:glycosyltransferase involved in cell wall biosynthesis
MTSSFVLDGIGRGVAEISTVFPYAAMHYVAAASHPVFSRQLRVSVIVCTKDRPACLAATLHSLYAQTTVPFELVVVDESVLAENARQTQDEFASPFAIRPRGMRFAYDHSVNSVSLSQARNRGKELARGDILLFLDQDVVLEPHFIEEILKAYQDDALLDGVAGTIVESQERRASWWKRLFAESNARDRRQSAAAMSFRAESIQGIRFEDGVNFCKRLLQRGPARLIVDPRALLRLQPS